MTRFLWVITEHLASCYSWGTAIRNISNSALRQGGASLWRYIWGWRVNVSPSVYVPLYREWVYYNFAAGSFISKKLRSRLHSIEINFYSKKGKVRFLSHPLGALEVTYALHLYLVGKPMYDFLFVIIELFSLALTAETLQAEICWRERFLKGVGHFDHPLKVKGDVAHEPLLGGRKLEGLPFHMV